MNPDAKLTRGEVQDYWSTLSERHLSSEDDGLGAICYAGMPAWFNRFLDTYQRKALARLVAGEEFAGARVLDTGTGVGRWARWFAARGASDVIGIDIEPVRLRTARGYGGAISYLEMPVNSLAFPASSFDVVNSITVLQHVDHDVKREAIAEFGRVLRSGGKAMVFEITDEGDDASHVYPWSEQAWVSAFAQNGFVLERTVGDQYIPILRLLKMAFKAWCGENARSEINQMKNGAENSRSRFVLPALHLMTLASYPVEETVRFLPSRFARMTGFVFKKI
jgi:ubiquinone/menaquinone biosynthesis C-methylase UbiE